MDINLRAAKAAAAALLDKFGRDTVVLDISKISVLADYFVIASGRNPSQIEAMANACEEAVLKEGLTLKHCEGRRGSSWCLLDFETVIAHIFLDDARSFYDLERVWADADTVEL